jgi:DNA-binding NarL/FixJ family response regulator
MATRIRVLLADSKPMRDAIGTLLKTEPVITITGEVSTYKDLLKELDGSTVDVVLMDIHMPGLRDSDFFKDVLRRFCILGMSFWANEETSRIADEFGAVQLLDNGNLVSTLIPAIKECARQGRAPGRAQMAQDS